MAAFKRQRRGRLERLSEAPTDALIAGGSKVRSRT